MFDDSKRLDKLEAQMAGVEKSIKELTAAIETMAKANDSKFKALDFANEDKDRQFLGIRKSRLEPLEDEAKSQTATLKNLSQRVALLENQMKKLNK